MPTAQGFLTSQFGLLPGEVKQDGWGRMAVESLTCRTAMLLRREEILFLKVTTEATRAPSVLSTLICSGSILPQSYLAEETYIRWFLLPL